jgi:hypothetical protein
VEEGILHIKLLKRPFTRSSSGEHRANGGRFDNQAKSLIVVHTGALCENLEDLVSVVEVKSPVRERLVCEYPFASDDVGAMRPGNKFPGSIAHQGLVLFLHSRTLIWIGKHDMNRGRDCKPWH